MQDNSIVISEVQRIKTIMTRHLLTESYVGLATDVVSRFSSKVGKVSSNFDNLFNQLRNVTSDNDAITIIQNCVTSQMNYSNMLDQKF